MGEGETRTEYEAQLGDLAVHPSRGSGAIDEAVLVELVRRGVAKGVHLADFFGVSGAAISKKLKRLQIFADRSVATGDAATKLMDAKLLGGARLVALAESAQRLLTLCETVVFAADEFAPNVIEAKSRLRRLVGLKGNVAAVAVALLGESRKQLEFVQGVQREVYNLKRVEEFQQVVLEEIRQAAPEVQQRITARLERVQAFRQGLDFSSGGAPAVR
jgi:hypothetical protein